MRINPTAVPGLTRAFGKLGGWVNRAIGQMGPVDLNNTAGWRKAATIRASEHLSTGRMDVMGAVRGAWNMGRSEWGRAKTAMNEAGVGYGIKDWWAGRTPYDQIALKRGALSEGALQRINSRAWTRRAIPLAVGGTIASDILLGRESTPSQAGRAALSAGAGVGITAALGLGVHPIAGAGFAAWSGLNMMRRGNQPGLF